MLTDECVQLSLRDEAEGATDRSRVYGGMNDALGYPSQGEAVMDTNDAVVLCSSEAHS